MAIGPNQCPRKKYQKILEKNCLLNNRRNFDECTKAEVEKADFKQPMIYRMCKDKIKKEVYIYRTFIVNMDHFIKKIVNLCTDFHIYQL